MGNSLVQSLDIANQLLGLYLVTFLRFIITCITIIADFINFSRVLPISILTLMITQYDHHF